MKKLLVPAALSLATLVGCSSSPQSQEQVREHTAAATRTITSDLKGAAQGIRDGLRSKPGTEPVDINTASRPTLEALPGITSAQARQIIDQRPFKNPSELVKRHILTREEYDRVSPRLLASH